MVGAAAQRPFGNDPGVMDNAIFTDQFIDRTAIHKMPGVGQHASNFSVIL